METIADALAIAIEHHEAGRLAQAEQMYRQTGTDTQPKLP